MAMNNEGRKVAYYEMKRADPSSSTSRFEKVKAGSGVFHAWGVNYEEFDCGPGSYTCAIIEMSDGQVELIPADMIKFNIA